MKTTRLKGKNIVNSVEVFNDGFPINNNSKEYYCN